LRYNPRWNSDDDGWFGINGVEPTLQKSLTDMFGKRAVPKKDVDKDENEGESPLSDLSDLSDDEEEHRC